MQEQRLSMMLVTNEYGGIAGLVTMKQLVGVIVGTVVDDDPPAMTADSSIAQLPDGAYLLDGGMTIIEINDRLHPAASMCPRATTRRSPAWYCTSWENFPSKTTRSKPATSRSPSPTWPAPASTRCA